MRLLAFKNQVQRYELNDIYGNLFAILYLMFHIL